MNTKKTSESNEMQNAIRKEQKEPVYTRDAHITLFFTRGVVYTILCTVLTLFFSFLVTKCYTPTWVDRLEKKVEYLGEEKDKSNLLLLGSGTVYEYLKGKDSTLLKDVVSMPIPTIPALKALREEKRPQQGDDLSWVIMSAMNARDTLIMGQKEIDDFYDNIGMIVRLHLMDDPLKVFVHPKALFEKQDRYITIEELKKIVEEKDALQFKLFRTSEGSSTRTLFEEALGFQISEKKSDFFDMNTTGTTFQDSEYQNRFIVLGSEYYGLKDENLLKECNSYVLVNNNKEKQEVKKQLYLYFAAYWRHNASGKRELYLMPQTENFIKKIERNFDFDRTPPTRKLIIDATK